MEILVIMLHLRALALVLLFICSLLVSALESNTLSCGNSSPDAFGYSCSILRAKSHFSQDQCGTFAILRANSHFSSLSNLSFYLGLNRVLIAEANGFSADTEFLLKNQALLIPIDCRCNAGFFQAEVTKTTVKGESFYSIAESLQGLTTCRAIKESNPGVSPTNLDNQAKLHVPLRCACPSLPADSPTINFLVTYPVTKGDTISKLAIKFNTTLEEIISVNNKSSVGFRPESLVHLTSILIPLHTDPTINSSMKSGEPNPRFPARSIHLTSPHKKSKMWIIGICVAVAGLLVGAGIATAAAFLVIQLKKNQQHNSSIEGDVEFQQLSASVRTTSDKKVSFEGSQDPLDDRTIPTTPHMAFMETYAEEELRKATEDFSPSNQIEGSVYHGRLNGMFVAVKRIQPKSISKIDFGLFHYFERRNLNIIKLLGICESEGPYSFLVFEFAKNGSLKDWLHGSLAFKNQFIASCNRFLTWNQRLKICLDVAATLQYMHHVMSLSYVHRNIKSRNIFLDEDFNSKLGNFGMSKCSEKNDTNETSWSIGYLAPEYVHHGMISPSMDIYAYGIVLLEILSGKTPITKPSKNGDNSVMLPEPIKSLMLPENTDVFREWMDPGLGENYPFDVAITVAELAQSCIAENPNLRPGAGEIVAKLSALVEETPKEDDMLVCENSSKPLVFAGASSL